MSRRRLLASAGIDTPTQDRLHFASFDLLTESRAELRELMREWTLAAAEMSAGQRRLPGPSRGGYVGETLLS